MVSNSNDGEEYQITMDTESNILIVQSDPLDYETPWHTFLQEN